MNPWAPTIVTGVLVFIGVVFNYAILGERVRVNAENLSILKDDLDNHKDAIWPIVNEQGREVARIKGHLGMNGGDYPHGKGSRHV